MLPQKQTTGSRGHLGGPKARGQAPDLFEVGFKPRDELVDERAIGLGVPDRGPVGLVIAVRFHPEGGNRARKEKRDGRGDVFLKNLFGSEKSALGVAFL